LRRLPDLGDKLGVEDLGFAVADGGKPVNETDACADIGNWPPCLRLDDLRLLEFLQPASQRKDAVSVPRKLRRTTECLVVLTARTKESAASPISE
jgi:hypothetical protein